MDYKEISETMYSEVEYKIIRMVCQIYEQTRQDNLVKWVEDNPKYWNDICKLNCKDIKPEYAEEIMEALMSSHIIELQIYWLCRCSDKLGLDGKMADE